MNRCVLIREIREIRGKKRFHAAPRIVGEARAMTYVVKNSFISTIG